MRAAYDGRTALTNGAVDANGVANTTRTSRLCFPVRVNASVWNSVSICLAGNLFRLRVAVAGATGFLLRCTVTASIHACYVLRHQRMLALSVWVVRQEGGRRGPGSCTAVRVVDRDPSTPEEGDIHKSKQQEGRVGR